MPHGATSATSCSYRPRSIAHELNRYGAPESLATTFIDIIDECEMARYTPVKSDEQIEQLYTRVSGAMKEMEGIKRAKR